MAKRAAAGLTVAIPAVFFHRFFVRRVDELVVAMEQEATKLVEVMQGNREVDFNGNGNGNGRKVASGAKGA